MRLFEIQSQRLLLCTRSPQKLGSVVSMDEPCDWLGREFEAAIEARRPDERLPRARSLILALSPNGTDYAYTVEPIGELEKQHEGWLAKIRAADPSQSGVLAHYADGYWSGKIFPELRQAPWEYRAASVRILQRFGGSARG